MSGLGSLRNGRLAPSRKRTSSVRTNTLSKLAVPVAVVLLAGCTSPGTAFEVNGNRVDEETITDTTAACLKALDIPQQYVGANKLPTVTNLIRGQLARQIEQQGLASVDQDELDDALEHGLADDTRQQLTEPECRAMTVESIKFSLLAEKIGPEKLPGVLESIDVRVNPKYGAYDVDTAQLKRGQTGSLSQTAETYRR